MNTNRERKNQEEFMKGILEIPSQYDKFWWCICGIIYLYMHQILDLRNFIADG